jgi:signal-transduction protein with cAMP-binding, CBS, and nucleotidyltransferase domain
MALFLGRKTDDVRSWRRTANLLDSFRTELKGQMAGLLSDQELAELHRHREAVESELEREDRFHAAFGTATADIASADGPGRLAAALYTAFALAGDYFRARGSVVATHSLCTAFLDQAVRTSLDHAERILAAAGKEPPAPWSWLASGVHGRSECTLSRETSGLLVWEGTAGDTSGYFGTLAGIASTMLQEAGIANHDAMLPSNLLWRGGISAWQERLSGTGAEVDPVLLADLRFLHGSPEPAATLAGLAGGTLNLQNGNGRMHAVSRRRSLLEIAKAVAEQPVGIDFFGRFRLEKSDPYRGRFDLERYATGPLVCSIRILAIRQDIAPTGTIDRIKALQEKGHLAVELAERLLQTYHEFTLLRIRGEAAGNAADACRFLDPAALSPEDHYQLKNGLETVEQLQMIVYQSLVEA